MRLSRTREVAAYATILIHIRSGFDQGKGCVTVPALLLVLTWIDEGESVATEAFG